MSDDVSTGRPAAELSDEELETQGKQLHDSRNWVFLHGSAAQFETHTQRMLELEQEYLRRFPKRTWQGSEDAERTTPADDPVGAVLHQLAGGLRAAMGYVGAPTIPELHERARFVRISGASLRESHVHDVTITRESPNYPSMV